MPIQYLGGGPRPRFFGRYGFVSKMMIRDEVKNVADKMPIKAADHRVQNMANNKPSSTVNSRANNRTNGELSMSELKRRIITFPNSDTSAAERDLSAAQCDAGMVKAITIHDFTGSKTQATKSLDAYYATEALMKLYRTASWSIRNRAERIIECDEKQYDQGIRTALYHLAEFAPTHLKQEFEERVTELFKTKWLLEIIETAMIKLRTYPYHGKHYYDALFYKYIDDTPYRESDLLLFTGLERSEFYKKKREGQRVLSRII